MSSLLSKRCQRSTVVHNHPIEGDQIPAIQEADNTNIVFFYLVLSSFAPAFSTRFLYAHTKQGLRECTMNDVCTRLQSTTGSSRFYPAVAFRKDLLISVTECKLEK